VEEVGVGVLGVPETALPVEQPVKIAAAVVQSAIADR
jgi:hypothetical protein